MLLGPKKSLLTGIKIQSVPSEICVNTIHFYAWADITNWAWLSELESSFICTYYTGL